MAEPPHHRLEVQLRPADNHLTARDRIRWQGAGTLSFTLHPDLAPERVIVDGQPYTVEAAEGPGRWQGKRALDSGEHEVVVRYSGRLAPGQEQADFRDILKGFAPRVATQGTYLPPGGAWVPNLGEDRLTYQLRVTGPADHRVVAAGERRTHEVGENRREVEFSYNKPVPGIALIGGPYRRHQGPGKGPVTAEAFLHPELTGLAEDRLATTEGYLAEFQDRYGPYPHPRFTLVSSPWPTGFGFPGLAYIGRRILPLPFIPRTSLPHEILHNWWGNGVYVATNSGNWAEGLTTYGADYRLALSRSDEAARNQRRQWLADFASYHGDAEAPALREFRARIDGASRTLGYNKAAFVWIMLRNRLGERPFRQGLRRFYDEFRYRYAGWRDLREAFEAVSGEDLTAFFEQWLDRKGAPRPALSRVRRGDSGITVTLTQPEPAYRLALPVRMRFADGRTRTRTVALTGARQTVRLDTGGKRPVRVRVDPDFRVFRRLTPAAIPPRLSALLARDKAGTIALAPDLASEAGREAAHRVGRRLWGGPPQVVSGAVNPAEVSVVVVPREKLADRMQRLGAKRELPDWPPQADARVALTRPSGSSQTVMVVGVTGPEALAALARPLPHYGSYGWLAFRDGDRLGRGRWPVREPSLTWQAPEK
ncbi:M1 family metallopeptidase [Thiohalorhabdus sp.]